LEVPKKIKEIKNLSNIHFVNIIKKFVYGFLIVSYLNKVEYVSNGNID
jgi:hypothetical protein